MTALTHRNFSTVLIPWLTVFVVLGVVTISILPHSKCTDHAMQAVNWKGCMKSGINLEKADLRYANLEGVNLSGANLSFSNLEGAILFNADLQGANLTGANLKNLNFARANLSGAKIDLNLLFSTPDARNQLIKLDKPVEGKSPITIRYLILRSKTLDGMDLSNMNFTSWNLKGTSFKNAKLTNANFYLALLNNADFTGANLSGASFNRAKLQGASFNKTTLIGADFTLSDFENLNNLGNKFKGALGINSAIFPLKFKDKLEGAL